MRRILSEGLEELGLKLSPQAQERFIKYYELLTAKNQVMNLTAITDEADVARLHFLDCAALLKAYPFSGKSVIDIGSGAGFPGVPLKILQDDIRLSLLDSHKKRVAFLSELGQALGLDSTSYIAERAEDAAAQLRETFDISVSRAVAKLNILCELCLPFVKPGGVFVAMKGPDPAPELNEAKNAIKLLGGGECGIKSYTIPGTDIVHSAVVIHKSSNTPAKYPRAFGQIKKTPL